MSYNAKNNILLAKFGKKSRKTTFWTRMNKIMPKNPPKLNKFDKYLYWIQPELQKGMPKRYLMKRNKTNKPCFTCNNHDNNVDLEHLLCLLVAGEGNKLGFLGKLENEKKNVKFTTRKRRNLIFTKQKIRVLKIGYMQ